MDIAVGGGGWEGVIDRLGWRAIISDEDLCGRGGGGKGVDILPTKIGWYGVGGEGWR